MMDRLAARYDLELECMVNHISPKSQEFQVIRGSFSTLDPFRSLTGKQMSTVAVNSAFDLYFI